MSDDRRDNRAVMRLRYLEKVTLSGFLKENYGEPFSELVMYKLQELLTAFSGRIPKSEVQLDVKAKWLDFRQSGIVITCNGEQFCTLTQ